ncbi:MAG TPA: glutamine synthetase family protein [Candidatus Saccharimonadales bacterium]|nr:glutamine synthetase family protein [Candidatus Saccharimonadales bacterium]
MPKKIMTQSIPTQTSQELPLRNFLELPYDTLEEMNLSMKAKRDTLAPKILENECRAYLEKETRIKAITLCFTDIEGRFHTLDYDKKFFLKSSDNLTFDGSSIRGFTQQSESDLRLDPDWTSMYFLPSDIFGAGKVIMFGNVLGRDHKPYESDFRGLLQNYAKDLKEKEGISAYAAVELEGFLLDGQSAEQNFDDKEGFTLVSLGGYFHSLPLNKLKLFIDSAAEAQRALGFENEKDHPEVAPSQFELNYSYTDALRACDLIQLYKLLARQIAHNMGMTACFLPKPIAGINGSGMHTNFSLAKNGKNIFYDAKGKEGLSPIAWDFIYKVLNHAQEICLTINSSVNAYRRLDPHFEAPNQVKVSPIDRGSMIRIPVGNERTARIEVRSVAPDSNPYLVLYTLMRTGLEGKKLAPKKSDRTKTLPGNIYDALRLFKQSEFVEKILGRNNKEKYLKFKQQAAERSPKELGTKVKSGEIIFHHEVTNQSLWNNF